MPTYKNYKKKKDKDKDKDKVEDLAIPISSNGSPNYKLLSSKKKPETYIDFEKIPKIKIILEDILKNDKIIGKS